jgi:hypothetical protein
MAATAVRGVMNAKVTRPQPKKKPAPKANSLDAGTNRKKVEQSRR